MFPLKDNIPLARFPLVTVVLVAINVIVYLLEIRHGGQLLRRARPAAWRCAAGRSPTSSPTLASTATWSRCRRSKASASAVACQGRRGALAVATGGCRAARDLGRRCSPRCSCTAASCTSSATCCSWRSSAPPSRTRWDAARFLAFYLLGGARRARRAGARRARTRRRRRSAPRGRSRPCSAATSCCIPARACSPSCSSSSSSPSSRCPPIALLGFWFVLQLAFGAAGLAGPLGGGEGVAYFAHVGGFAFGLLVIRLFATARKPQPPPVPVY